MNACATPEVLEQLLSGGMAESQAAFLRNHLEGCPMCRSRLDALSDHAELTQWLAESAPLAEPSYDMPVTRLLFQRLGETPLQISEVEAPPHGSLSFLAGAKQEGELGSFGPYRVLSELGRGGMGIVLKAYDEELERTVAVKVLRPDRADEQARRRFVREARAVAGITHDHVVSVFTVANPSDSPPYLVMQYIKGPTLAERIRSEQRLGPKEAARICFEVARGLEAAHHAGLVHRDIKPSNILLDTVQRRAKLSDFGLARIQEAPTVTTQDGTIPGTPEYMSPEQIREPERIDGRSDIYSLGVTLYESLTGTPPFRGTPVMVLQQILNDQPLAPRRISDKLPRDLETICLKAIAKEPARRYTTARDLADDLDRWLNGKPIQARRTGWLEQSWSWCRRNPALAVLICSVALLLGASAVGASLAALWLRDERDFAQAQLKQTERAERQALQRLYDSRLAQAQARRWSERIGQRFDGLDALNEAVKLRPFLQQGSEADLPLRNEAIACLARADLRLDSSSHWLGYPPGSASTVMAFDADVERYALVDKDGSITVRRLVDNSEVVRLTDLVCPSRRSADWRVSLRFSRDGRYLASRGISRQRVPFQLWDLRGCEKMGTGSGPTPKNMDNTEDRQAPVPIFSQPLSAPRCTFKLPGGPDWYFCDFDFSPDCRIVAVGGTDGSVCLHEVSSGRLEKRMSSGTAPLCIRYQPSGKMLAVCRGPHVEILDCTTGQVVRRLVHESGVGMVSWSADGERLACACSDGQGYIWQLGDNGPPILCKGHRGGLTYVSFNHAGDLASTSSWDGTTRLWDPACGTQLMVADGSGMDFSRDDRWLAFGLTSPAVGRWEVAVGRELRRFHGHTPGTFISRLDISPDGRLLASAAADGVRLWDLVSGRQLEMLPIGNSKAVLFDFSGQFLITAGSAGVHRWSLGRASIEPGARLHVGPPPSLPWPSGSQPTGAALSSDGGTLAVAGFNSGLVFSLPGQGGPPRMVKDPNMGFVATSADGALVATGTRHGHESRVWDAKTGKLLAQFPGRTARVAFSPDQRWLVIGTASDYAFYEVGQRWTLHRRIQRNNAASMAGVISFARKAPLLALTDSPRSIKLLDSRDQQEIATISAPDLEEITDLTFTPDGSMLAAGTGSGVIQVWDLHRLRGQLQEMEINWQPTLVPSKITEGVCTVTVDYGELQWLVHERRAWADQQRRRWGEAATGLSRAIELKPDRAASYNTLAWLLATCPEARFRDPARAIQLAENATRLDVSQAAYWNTLGVARYRAGKWAEAITALKQSMQRRSGGNSIDWLFLAMTHWQMRDKVQARQWYQRALVWMEANPPGEGELKRFHAEAASLLEPQNN